MINLETEIKFTTEYLPDTGAENDFRYRISPKKKSDYQAKPYTRVFSIKEGYCWKLSIVDLLFNMGPDTISFL